MGPDSNKDTKSTKFTFKTNTLDKLRQLRADRQYTYWDAEQPGLCVLISPGRGKAEPTITLRVCYYVQRGKPQYFKIGRYPDGEFVYPYDDLKNATGPKAIGSLTNPVKCSNLKQVRLAANVIRTRAQHGQDPRTPPLPNNFTAIVDEYLEHVKAHRTWKETARIFRRYVLPAWGRKIISDINGDDVRALLTAIHHKRVKAKIADKEMQIGSPVMATATFVQLSALFGWYGRYHGNFQSPIKRGMSRDRVKAAQRDRTLKADELRALWACAEGTYGTLLKVALLTAQRFRKVANMRRADLKDHVKVESYQDATTGDWVPEARIEDVWNPRRDDDPANKGVSLVPLSALARDLIASLPLIDGEGDWVFTCNGRQPLQGFGKFKKQLDRAMLAHMRAQAAARGDHPDNVELRPWQHRDLRRTARTLMSRAGVADNIAELCLAHKIKGVKGTYDRYHYLPQQRDAFARLAAIMERIVVHPADDNKVVSLRR